MTQIDVQKLLNELPVNLVGDGQMPNMFFVSVKGNVVLATTDAHAAYGYWEQLNPNQDSALEDRLNGVVCSSSIEDETDTRIIIDDMHRFGLLD